MKDKSSLRDHFKLLLKGQAQQERAQKSRIIAEKLFVHPAFQKAQTLLFYASCPGEVETFAMMSRAIQLKKRVALPVIEKNQRKMIPTLTESLEHLTQGEYGINAPQFSADKAVRLEDLDAVIVPGLAFDKQNNRLGRGAGYYDRFLSQLAPHTATIGLAFDFQIVDCLPVERHDVTLSYIIAN